MANDTNGQHLEEFKLYRYTPNLAANVIFVVLFALAAIGHIIVLVRRKTWYFIPFVIGCLCAFTTFQLSSADETRS